MNMNQSTLDRIAAASNGAIRWVTL